MAIGHNLLDTNTEAGSDTTIASASVSPAANALILVVVISVNSVANEDPTSVSGAGLTFTKIASAALSTSPNKQLSIYRALDASPSSGAITVTWADANTNKVLSIHEFTGVDTGGTNGSAAVVQFNTGATNGNTLTITLSSFGDATNNVAVLCFGKRFSTNTVHDTSFTEETELFLSNVGSSLGWRIGEDTSIVTVGSTFNSGVALELKAAVGGGGFNLYSGTNLIPRVYRGSNEIFAIYEGSNLRWEKA